MVEAGKKTGSVFFFEPLHDELNDTFGAMTNVAPEVFSVQEKAWKRTLIRLLLTVMKLRRMLVHLNHQL